MAGYISDAVIRRLPSYYRHLRELEQEGILQISSQELGERMGVKKSQVSRLESGKSITYATIVRAFRALGAQSASLDLGSLGRVALW